MTSLCERGDDVVVLTRGTGRASALGPRSHCCRGAGKTELVQWTPEQRGDWARAVDGVDAVVNLAGAGIVDARWTSARKHELRASRVRTTELLSEAIVSATKKPRVLVSGSAVGYYGTSTGDRILTEQEPPGEDFLAKLTRDWEDATRAASAAGVRVCLPRTGLVLGRGGGLLGKLLPVFRTYMGGPVGDGRQYLPWIHVVDAVRAIEHAIENDDLSGAFNLTAPDPVTMNHFARALGEALERPSSLRVPALAIKLALGEAAETVLTGQRAIPKCLVDRAFAFVFPELTSALADLVAVV